jgi:hypothetical protein
MSFAWPAKRNKITPFTALVESGNFFPGTRHRIQPAF